jgi:hypothetical protein
MKARMRRTLIRLYPASWRARYEEEFSTFLEAEHARTALNIIAWACRERVRAFIEDDMAIAGRGLTLMVYAYLASIVAGVNLYWTVDDTPLVGVMRFHVALFAFWRIVAWGAFVALAAAVGASVPIVFAMMRSAVANRRYDILRRLAFPPLALATLVVWIALVTTRTHWAPTPWDITGEWAAPAHWPPLAVRWVLGSITGLALSVGVVGTAIALSQAIDRSNMSQSTFTRLMVFVLAASIVCMAVGVAGWGLLAGVYAPATFRSAAGGIFGSPSVVSWTLSAVLFVGAAVAAVRGVRASNGRLTH